MCKLVSLPPGLLLIGPEQAPVSWLLFAIIGLVLLRGFFSSLPCQSASTCFIVHAVCSTLFTDRRLCSYSRWSVSGGRCGSPSLEAVNYWFQGQVSLLHHTCQGYTDQYVALNKITGQASHAETYPGLLVLAGLTAALACARLCLRTQSLVCGGKGSQPSQRGISLFWNCALAALFLLGTSLIYALPSSLDGAGCDQSCGLEGAVIRLSGSVVGFLALLVTLLALTRGMVVLVRRRDWDWLAGILLLLAVSGVFFLQILSGPVQLDQPYRALPDLLPSLNLPGTALVFILAAFLPVSLMFYMLSRSRHA